MLVPLVGRHDHGVHLPDHVFRAFHHVLDPRRGGHMPGIGGIVGPDVGYLDAGDAQGVFGLLVEVD